jgi:hypothetical protein
VSEGAAGSARLHAELASYGPATLTVRVLQVVFTMLPFATPLPPYQSLDEAASHVFAGVPPDVLDRARQLVADPRVDQALFAARSIDTGDTGLTIVSGVRSAVALFFGKQGRSEAVAQQQRMDAALKALGLAYLMTKLVPLPPADRVELVSSVPAGTELITYYGAVEIALPFADKVTAAGGTFVRDLLREQGRAMADKLLGIVGRQGVADAEEMLAQLTDELDPAAPHAAAMAEQIRAMLPAYATSAGDLFDIVAAGADALPCYRYLCARLAIETALALAKHEMMPEVGLPVAAASRPVAAVPDAPPLPPDLLLRSSRAMQLPSAFDEPLGEPAGEAPVEPAGEPAAEPQPHRPPVGHTIVADILDEPEPFDWPTAPLPETRRLRGMFLAGDPPGEWRVFTVEGVYSEHPPHVPSGMDWDELRGSGHRVALYHREGDRLAVTSPEGARTEHDCSRSQDNALVTFDGRPFRRTDWDLTGRHLDGQWRAGEERLRFTADGQVTRATPSGARSGRYKLGVGAVELAWDDKTETLTLLSDLKPSSRRPAALWLGGTWWFLEA